MSKRATRKRYIGAFIHPEAIIVIEEIDVFESSARTENRIAERILDGQVLDFKRHRARHDVETIPVRHRISATKNNGFIVRTCNFYRPLDHEFCKLAHQDSHARFNNKCICSTNNHALFEHVRAVFFLQKDLVVFGNRERHARSNSRTGNCRYSNKRGTD